MSIGKELPIGQNDSLAQIDQPFLESDMRLYLGGKQRIWVVTALLLLVAKPLSELLIAVFCILTGDL